VSALTTISLAVVTVLTLLENLRVTHEPRIAVLLEQDSETSNLIALVVTNVGPGPAYKVSFELEPNIEYAQNIKPREIGFIKEGIEYMAPGQRYRSLIADINKVSSEKLEEPLRIQVTYNDFAGTSASESFGFNFLAFRNVFVTK
jgi:hypothetical protein